MLQEALIAYWSYTLQDVRDRSGRSGLDGTLLPYVPQEMIGAGVSFAPGDVRAGIQWSYVSHQYAQSGQPWLGLLPSYHVLAANIDVQSRIRGLALMVRLQANNLLYMRYSVIQGFPMPGRSFRVLTTLRWEATS
jgi:outer membrane receptor protein involved in Fe transport